MFVIWSKARNLWNTSSSISISILIKIPFLSWMFYRCIRTCIITISIVANITADAKACSCRNCRITISITIRICIECSSSDIIRVIIIYQIITVIVDRITNLIISWIIIRFCIITIISKNIEFLAIFVSRRSVTSNDGSCVCIAMKIIVLVCISHSFWIDIDITVITIYLCTRKLTLQEIISSRIITSYGRTTRIIISIDILIPDGRRIEFCVCIITITTRISSSSCKRTC